MIKVVPLFELVVEYLNSFGKSFPFFCHEKVVYSPIVILIVQFIAIVSPKSTV